MTLSQGVNAADISADSQTAIFGTSHQERFHPRGCRFRPVGCHTAKDAKGWSRSIGYSFRAAPVRSPAPPPASIVAWGPACRPLPLQTTAARPRPARVAMASRQLPGRIGAGGGQGLLNADAPRPAGQRCLRFIRRRRWRRWTSGTCHPLQVMHWAHHVAQCLTGVRHRRRSSSASV